MNPLGKLEVGSHSTYKRSSDANSFCLMKFMFLCHLFMVMVTLIILPNYTNESMNLLNWEWKLLMVFLLKKHHQHPPLKYRSFQCLLFMIAKVQIIWDPIAHACSSKVEKPEINVNLSRKTGAASADVNTVGFPIKLLFEVKHMNEQPWNE